MRAHDSQAYRKMNVTRERISRILELREILLLFETGFSLVNVDVVCAILESISGLEPSSVITEPQVLEACSEDTNNDRLSSWSYYGLSTARAEKQLSARVPGS